MWKTALMLLLAVGCHSPGPYGYSRTYSPLDAEEDASASVRELDPVMLQRAKEDWRNTNISVFGIVSSRREAANGNAYLTLSMRTLAPRNLCDSPDEESCRVTVGDHEHAIVHAVARLSGEDDLGRRRVAPGSLVRVIGRLADQVGDGGAPVLVASYLRHWPRGEYVTLADSDHMRR